VLFSLAVGLIAVGGVVPFAQDDRSVRRLGHETQDDRDPDEAEDEAEEQPPAACGSRWSARGGPRLAKLIATLRATGWAGGPEMRPPVRSQLFRRGSCRDSARRSVEPRPPG
jgi:hypothetical protein